MDEAWERAVEAALHTAGEGSSSPARSLTLDGAVKCMHGRLPAAEILERHQSLEHLSIAGVGVASLAGFPRLRNLTRLTLSDNRIAGGLEHLVEAGLASLRDLDLSNNRIQNVDDLAPLARLRLVSLDLYECPVTRVKDYRSRVFGLIRTLKYLDKMDADENERPESDDDDDDADGEGEGDAEEEDDDEDDDDEDPGSGEVANGGVTHSRGSVAPRPVEVNGVIHVDEDESEADEVVPNGEAEHHHRANGFRVAAVGVAPDEDDEDVEDDDDDAEEEYEEEDDLGEEIDEEVDEDDTVVEVLDVPSSDDEEDGIDEDDDDEEEEVEDDGEEAEPESSGRVAVAVGGVGEEIDGHEQGEGDDEDENGEIGEEDEERLEDSRVYEDGNDDDDADDEDEDTEYLVQPIVTPQPMAVVSPGDFDIADPDDVDEDRDEVDDDDDDEGGTDQPSSSQGTKRKRDDDPSGSGSDDEDDDTEDPRPSKRQ
ncbi:hypothetical protein ZWY2020_008909 [Hordeum vulgare]|nr:hypothetical protein ZWY2020_008909 [Hordeum vulgare]